MTFEFPPRDIMRKAVDLLSDEAKQRIREKYARDKLQVDIGLFFDKLDKISKSEMKHFNVNNINLETNSNCKVNKKVKVERKHSNLTFSYDLSDLKNTIVEKNINAYSGKLTSDNTNTNSANSSDYNKAAA